MYTKQAACGVTLQYLRITQRLTKKEVADLLDIPLETYETWETGQISVFDFVSVLEAIQVPMDVAVQELKTNTAIVTKC